MTLTGQQTATFCLASMRKTQKHKERFLREGTASIRKFLAARGWAQKLWAFLSLGDTEYEGAHAALRELEQAK